MDLKTDLQKGTESGSKHVNHNSCENVYFVKSLNYSIVDLDIDEYCKQLINMVYKITILRCHGS